MRISLYILTYNAPKQLNLWCETFLLNFPNFFVNCRKLLINNSDNYSLNIEYKEVIENYDLEIIFNEGNIGINDGRLLAAKHFHKSEEKYMIFFEDDMLINGNSDIICKSGFKTFNKRLFEVLVNLMEMEEFDYIKLSFSEVFGDNSENWAWYTVKDEFKDKLFFNLPNGESDKATIVDYIKVYEGLPYASGDFFYCNWPLIFGKNGNKKIFLDEIFKENFETRWMLKSLELHRQQKLKAGCLLLSPIKHNRVFDYDRSTRKENHLN
jgi:hypothetical protein